MKRKITKKNVKNAVRRNMMDVTVFGQKSTEKLVKILNKGDILAFIEVLVSDKENREKAINELLEEIVNRIILKVAKIAVKKDLKNINDEFIVTHFDTKFVLNVILEFQRTSKI